MPSATAVRSRDQEPPAAAIVPREPPSSNSSTVEPDSAEPVTLSEVPTVAPSGGAVTTGAAGGVVSTRRTTHGDAADVPLALVARAVKRWSPSAMPVTTRDQEPLAAATAVPREGVSSNSSTVLPGSALPVNVALLLAFQL